MKSFISFENTASADQSAQNPPVKVSRECLREGRLAMAQFDAHVWKHYYEAAEKIFSTNASDGRVEHLIQHYKMLGWEMTEIPTESSIEFKFVLPIELTHSFIIKKPKEQQVPPLEPQG